MADEDEIDVLGDFSFNSCFAQNSQGIPSCSNREDTVHPQWLLDSTATNWYDIQNKKSNSINDKSPVKVLKTKEQKDNNSIICTAWSSEERRLLVTEMRRYGRNIQKISQSLKTKTAVEVQALMDAEYGINLETHTFGLDKNEGHEDVPVVVQEEIVTDDTQMTPKKMFRRKKYNLKTKNRSFEVKNTDEIDINPGDIVYEDELMLGSTESIGSDLDLTDIVSKNIEKCQNTKVGKKMGNHRRKVLGGYDKLKSKNKGKDIIKSPQGRRRKDSSLSDDSVKSPKLQIVLGSGVALPVSEGEQVIKIEKKKDSEPESDIDVDIDSDNEDSVKTDTKVEQVLRTAKEAPIAVPLRKFEPMTRRPKKINLDGGGGYTIMHTDAGDLYEISSEPRKERAPRKQPIHLLQCRMYNAEKPAPYDVLLHVSALISMDVHGHTSRAEVMGLVGGTWAAGDARPAAGDARRAALTAVAYCRAAAAAGDTHCDMDPVSQSVAAEALRARGLCVCGWHHSHPVFAAWPSARDLRTQRALQRALERAPPPFLALITSQSWPAGRTASHYRCIRVEDDENSTEDLPVGYQFSVKLVADLTLDSLPAFLEELTSILCDTEKNSYSVDMTKDVCPQAKMTYLEKCLSSLSHHMRSAGYEDDDPVVTQLIQGVRDIFR